MKFCLAAVLPFFFSVAFAELEAEVGRKPQRECSSSSSSSSSSDYCGEQRKLIELYDFNRVAPMPDVPGNAWEYAELPLLNFTTRGGTFSTGPNGGFVDANPYNNTSRFSSQLDSLKFLLENSQLVDVPEQGKLSIEWEVAVENFKVNQSPFPSDMVSKNDVRLGSGVLFFHDLENDLYFDWLITNDHIYARYARDTFASVSAPGYAAFVFIIPVAERRFFQYNKLRVTLNSINKSAHWFVDGKEVFSVTNVGYLLPDRNLMTLDLGGIETAAFPRRLRVSFGAVTLLDNYPACQRSSECSRCKFPKVRTALVNQGTAASPKQYNPLLGAPVLATYWDNDSLASNILWGQGTTMSLKKLAIWATYPDQC